MADNYAKETICIQSGWKPKNGESRNLPIIQSTTFKYESSEAMGRLFDLEDSVRVSDIKSIINQFYSRAQLWFVDNNPEFLTVQDALNLIKFTAFRGEELDVEVKKKWNKELTFKGDYDPSKVISRYEFAVLFDMYASPFVKKVSQDGATIYR